MSLASIFLSVLVVLAFYPSNHVVVSALSAPQWIYVSSLDEWQTNASVVIEDRIDTRSHSGVRVRQGTLLLLGTGQLDGKAESWIGGNLTVDDGAELLLDGVMLHVNGSRISFNGSAHLDLQHNATISVDTVDNITCLDADAMSSSVTVESSNATLEANNNTLVLISNLTCVLSGFSNLTIVAVVGIRGTGGSTSWTWSTSSGCNSASMLAIAFTVACPSSPPPLPPTLPLPPQSIIADDPPVWLPKVPASSSPNSVWIGSSPTPTLSPVANISVDTDYTTAIVASVAAIAIVLVATIGIAVMLIKVPWCRLRLAPFRDRVHFKSSRSAERPYVSPTTSMTVGATPPRPYHLSMAQFERRD